jgi:hypothetical protein
MRSAAIMQPTFLPWLGYFALIEAVDCFVFLDDVQFSKQSWQSRNRVLGPNGAMILGLPVARKPSKPLIRDTRLADRPVRDEILGRAQGCLGTAPYWALVEQILSDGLARPEAGLAAVNIGLIKRLVEVLDLNVKFVQSSDLVVTSADKSGHLLAICDALEVSEYLSPMGALDYLTEINPFSEATVRLRFQTFEHPTYTQRWGEFTSHMSVIDALAYLGPDGTAALIRAGTKAPRTIDDAKRAAP